MYARTDGKLRAPHTPPTGDQGLRQLPAGRPCSQGALPFRFQSRLCLFLALHCFGPQVGQLLGGWVPAHTLVQHGQRLVKLFDIDGGTHAPIIRLTDGYWLHKRCGGTYSTP